MSDYHWPDLRALAIRLYNGDPPGPALEQRIIDIFENHPQLVALAIDRIAERYTAGTVKSPWAVLAKHVESAAQPGANVAAQDTTDRDKATRNTEQWIRTAGMHFDRWDEVNDELFGDRGRLRPWKTDLRLVERMRTLWAEHRPTGEQLEAEELQRANHWTESQTSIKQALRKDHA